MERSIKDLLVQKKIVAICRSIYGEELKALAEALLKGGVGAIEVTFDQADPDHLEKTPRAIRMLAEQFPGMAAGAGTVVTAAQLKAAAAGGAAFIISPNTDLGIIRETKAMGLVSIPGAMTPSEIAAAWQAGADFVKLFPCAQLGPDYVKAIRAPLNDVPLMATGGIDADNLETYLSLGMMGAGMGGNLCNKKLLREKRFDELEAYARRCMAVADRFPADR